MESLWSDGITLPSFEPLTRDINTDVLIIGGGITGILCAYLLAQRGVPYVLAEGRQICRGVTANTTAKITSQHGLCYAKLREMWGVERAQRYLAVNQEALATYRSLCGKIPCGFQTKTSFVYSLTNRKKLEAELTVLDALGFPAVFAEHLPLPFPTVGAVAFAQQAQFHPLRFLAAIAKGLQIYEQTPVREIRGHTAITDGGTITTKKIIVATHFPFLNKHGSYFLKLYQSRSYVIALKNAPDVGGMYVDEAERGLSLRNHNNLLLLGGGSHRTGKTGGKWQALTNAANRYYPQADEQYRWATQDCMTLDGVPYIGHYSAQTPDLFVATGFQKWGMTTAMVAARLLTDLVMDIRNDDAALFSPSRSMLRPQLARNALEATVNLLTPTTKRCSHMGCALKWNPQEHSWDCACHGSRFSQHGEVLNHPAKKGIQKRK